MASLNLPNLVSPPLNAHYEGEYDDRMQRWREIGAQDKSRNIAFLLGQKANDVASVLEVGCGTGAVLLELSRRGLGASHTGVDMADPNLHPHPGVSAAGITMQTYDGKRIPFPDASFDFVYATHVLEHVDDERGFLTELARVARRWIYVEVPCEINARMNIPALQSTLNIGHINAYTPETLSLTLSTAGLRPVDIQAHDHSMAVHEFYTSKLKARLKAGVRRTVLRLNSRWATKIFTYHVGALCEASSDEARIRELMHN